jgi:CTP:molybdopterin cytidylyltransferase MocA
MEAVVMAAGEGRRLQPLTDRFAKPVLPIDGRPVIVTFLRELQAAGLGRVTVVTGHLAAQVEALLAGFDHELRFVRQPQADGSAAAVRRAGLDPPYLVAGADTLFRRGDVAAFLAGCKGADGGLAVRRRPGPGPGRTRVKVENGLVTRIFDDDPGNPLAGAPLWLFGEKVHAELADLSGPPFENATAVMQAIGKGARIAGVEIGPTRDLTHPADVATENFGYLRSL